MLHCPRCGQPVAPGQPACANCGQPFIAQPQPPYPQGYGTPMQQPMQPGLQPGMQQQWQNSPPTEPPPSTGTALALAIVCSLCCCLPGGIAGIVLAVQAGNLVKLGDYAGARAKLKTAWTVIIIAAILGLIVNGIAIGLQVAAEVAKNA
jgi:hypothetical protein